ncbi:AMP-dependent synthetase/ligase [Sandaracinus amylolyticus]|uniref:Long-chain-fatty-acid--CoA ligase n=1 Tax=Sandaracinus amylolyticus TaxID=927083 RepID=A0A0F6YK83_9BACT|nr:long-chain fatty acid--CoA ligase [Sandaracinus amylolyticus]AKF08585.1 Long-chain-fatty-acid--CoA ligase [Sandaracinus amylolyticus]
MLELGPDLPARTTAPAARTLGEMFFLRCARSASLPALHRKREGAWDPITWQGFLDGSAKVARGLLALGLGPGDRVAILGPTQPAWAIDDLGAQLAGMVSFGIYPKQSPEQVRYLLEHSEAKVVFVDEAEEIETVLAAAKGLKGLVAIVPWTMALYRRFEGRDPRLVPPTRFEGEALPERDIREIQERIDPEDTAILIYTSGTTGPPKGAMIAHRNILTILRSASEATNLRQSDLSLNFLPMAHAAERVLGFYGRVDAGIPAAYAQSTATVLDDLKSVAPTVFGSVPRIFEKAHAKIFSEIEKQKPAVQRLFAWANTVGKRRLEHMLAGRPVPARIAAQYAIADRLVFQRIRAAFGGRVRMMVTGAAPTAPAILEFFWAAGLPIYEAYGMTESTVVTHINREGAVKLGTVGRVIPPSEHRIAPDGEILVRGPWVFKGYLKNPQATEEMLEGGWLHTGDVGVIDGDGYLKITDRKKHLIITAGGKNLSPANIEKAIKEQDPLISQVHAHGDRRNYVAAIVAPSPIETLEWGIPRGLCTKEELDARQKELMANPSGRTEALNLAMAKVVAHPEFRERIRAAVRRGNEHLARVEQVRRFVILDRDFSQEQGELTPTMKVKRKEVEAKYASLLDRAYTEDGFALEP